MFSEKTERAKFALGKQLEKARRRRGWKLEQVAHRSGRRLSRISEMETGRANSTVDNLEDVGNALGLRLMFVPVDKVEAVSALIGQDVARRERSHGVRSILEQVFVEDDEEDEYAP